jgi:protein SERAC1
MKIPLLQIVANRGLETLVEFDKLDPDHSDTKIALCRIVANLTAFASDPYDYFVTGWIGILSGWSHNIDIRLQVTASLALANLDHDDPNHCVFGPRVYQLYPTKRQKVAPKLDIVFVHGLLGGVFITWRQKDREVKNVSLSSKKELVIPHSRDKVAKGRVKAKPAVQVEPPAVSLSEEQTLIGSGEDKVVKMEKLQEKPKISISDPATQEVFQALHQDDLGSDWCVVYPDVPVGSNEGASIDELSVSGDHWQREGHDDYTYCWPMEWLPEDFRHIRVIGLNYESSLSQWTSANGCSCEKDKGKLKKRGAEFMDRLAGAKVGNDRPVVWVGHSMGGLLIKSILVQSLQQATEAFQQIAKNSTSVLFLGTPHRGSSIAKMKQHTSAILWPSVEVQELEENAKPLLQLHDDFLKLLTKTKYPMEIVSITEGRPTVLTSWKVPFRIVNDESAQINHGDFYMTNDDHLGISKPMCRHSFFYRRLVRMIANSLRHPAKERAEDVDEMMEEQTRAFYRKIFENL